MSDLNLGEEHFYDPESSSEAEMAYEKKCIDRCAVAMSEGAPCNCGYHTNAEDSRHEDADGGQMSGQPLNERYVDEIDRFFRDEHFHITLSPEKGHVWIAGRYRDFQALTVEPPEGGQYEIAVRFPLHCDHPHPWDKYSGYIALNGYMIGRNTDGH